MFRPSPMPPEQREVYNHAWAAGERHAVEQLVVSLVDQYGLEWAEKPGLPFDRSGPCRRIYDLLQEHPYSWGGPCGGCNTCGRIDDDDTGWFYEDHFVELMVEKFNLKWKRSED